jgi:uncharacterized spore protein YtfJ
MAAAQSSSEKTDGNLKEGAMDMAEMATSVRDMLTVRRVFGEPYERDGVTVIPVATIVGGAGGGKGEREHAGGGEQEGEGGGFGLIAKPAGVYVIHGDQVRWQPSIDLNRIIAGGQLVAVVALLVIRRFLRVQQERASS